MIHLYVECKNKNTTLMDTEMRLVVARLIGRSLVGKIGKEGQKIQISS